MDESSCLIIAHRGESFEAPENTMAAIDLAWENGAEAVEIDVQLSKDKKVVVIHDYNTKRVAGVNRMVKNQTFEELRNLDVGSWKDIQWKGETIPTLQEVLKSVPQNSKLIIEIKTDEKIIPFIEADLDQINLNPKQVEFIGFNFNCMVKTKERFSEHKVLWLLDLDYYWYNKIFKPSIKKAISKVKRNKLDGLNLFAGNLLNKKMIDHIHDAGLLAYCWTVNDIERAKALKAWGIDAITTDGSKWLKSHIDQIS